MGNETRTHRCAACDQDWPYIKEYQSCPICAEPTYSTTTTSILSINEALGVIGAHKQQIERRQEIERKMDEALIAKALATIDDELSSLLC